MLMLGISVVGSACQSKAIAVVRDTSHFYGVKFAAHELGHV